MEDAAAPVILDFATSQVALGKVRVAYRAGKLMEDGILIDHRGQPTRDRPSSTSSRSAR